MFGLTVVTAPDEEPVTLDEAKAHLRFYVDHEDDLIRALIVAARMYCETWTGKAFVTQELRLTRDTFPGCDEEYIFRLPRPPLITLTPDGTWTDLGITYTDSNGDEQEVSAATYVVDVSTEVGRIGLASGETWPTDVIDQIGAVKVQYLAGFGDRHDVPKTIKQAMLLLIGHWFVNREAAITGTIQTTTELAVQSLLLTQWTGSLVGAYG